MTLKSLIDKPKELLELINECLKPKNKEKKQFGEVFTPMKLVEEMLDKLPEDVWTKKDLTWLDPSSGMGNYPIAVYLRLMESLKKDFPDEKERKKHILENMLFMCEINKKNVYTTKQIFDVNNEYKLNIYEGDTLECDVLKEFGRATFDVILGNPPYQEVDENNKTKGGTNLYTKFINFGFDKLKTDGYLAFITPISWLGPSTNIQSGGGILHNIFLKYDVLHLNLNECKKYFTVGSTFSYYIVRKSISHINTTVVSEYKKSVEKSILDLKKYSNLKFLPIHLTSKTIELVNSVISNENKFKIERCRKLDSSTKNGREHLRLKQDEKFKYITHHTSTKTYYSDIKLDNFSDTKILINMSGYLKPQICKDCNITESKYYITTSNEQAEKIVELLNSPDITYYLQICKYSGFNSRPVLESIKIII
jgi:hypothetical protein